MYFEKSDSLKLDFTKKPKQKEDLTPFQEEDLNRLIEMAWKIEQPLILFSSFMD